MGFGIVYLVVYGKFDLNREPKFGDLETYCVPFILVGLNLAAI